MNTQERLLYIIKRIAKEACSTKQLTEEVFATTDKNKQRLIQMDINLLKNHFEESIDTDSHKYKFLKLPYFMQNITTVDGIKMKELIEFIMVFDNKMLSLFEKEEPLYIKKIRKEIKPTYLIHEPPFEVLHSLFLDDIRKAIKWRQYVTLEYERDFKKKTYVNIQIYRIIYASGNWYIAIYDAIWKKTYNFLRINFIKSVTLHPKTFQRDIETEKAIDGFQSLFSKPDVKPFEVVVEVSDTVMRFFKEKKHLKSQKIIEESEEGLRISYEITYPMEILPLIKHWMPYIQVISPKSIQKKLCKDAEIFLEKQRKIIDDKKDV